MALSILNNIPSLVAENQLNTTQANLQKTLYQLASGSRSTAAPTMQRACPSPIAYRPISPP